MCPPTLRLPIKLKYKYADSLDLTRTPPFLLCNNVSFIVCFVIPTRLALDSSYWKAEHELRDLRPHITAPDLNTCCYETPGGLIMQTQFWDTDVPGSPADSWTIHGLWPNNCDGTYMENCDPSRDYTDISELLSSQGGESTLEYMQQYWLNDDGTNEELWAHEWATHGTCYSTLQVDCLPSGSPVGADAVAFFETVVGLFQTLPTYTWLADAGITPSESQTYSLSDILSALESGSGGYTPAVGCRSGTLDSISWYFNIEGSLIDGKFIPINSPEESECPSSNISYPPREGS